MSGKLTARSIQAGIGFLIFGAVYFAMLQMGFHRTVLMIPVTLAWITALAGIKPMVHQEKQTGLYFAFGVMAVMIFFLHETYEYTSKVRTFPLIIGYTGIVLSLFDIFCITDTRFGHAITRVLGAELEVEEESARTVSRELITFAAMGAGVVGIWLFGFLIASPVFVMAWMRTAGRKSVKQCLYGGFFTLVFIYGLFEVLLKYELYLGVVTSAVKEMILG